MWKVYQIGVLFSALAGCDGSQTTTIENSGAVCLVPDGHSVTIFVQIDACLQGSCRRARNVRCEARVADGRITITSHAEIVEAGAQDQCPDSCDPAVPTCELRASAGQYTIVHGTEEATATLPLRAPVSIFGPVGGCEAP